MEWINIETGHLPDKEILAVNDRSDFMIGWLSTEYSGNITCSNDECEMYNCTHYAILIPPNAS